LHLVSSRKKSGSLFADIQLRSKFATPNEEVYLKAFADLVEAERNLRAYFRFYNDHRPHSAHDGQTPSEAYIPSLEPLPINLLCS
jgi:transposase InsO family protein